MKRKKALLILLMLGTLVFLVSCKSKVLITFDWYYTPDSFYASDPSLPDTITRGVEYETSAGYYDFTTYWYISSYWYYYTLYYTLTENTGLFPKDAIFEIYCWYDDYPSISQIQGLVPVEAGALSSVNRSTRLPSGTKEVLKTWDVNQGGGGYQLSGKAEFGRIVP